MSRIPRSILPDDTLSVAYDGYRFVSKRCEKLGTDFFQTRLMLKKTICMKGQEAAEIFYDTDRFERKDVAPNIIKSTLFGHGGVQGMDGEAHHHRKKMFMDLMGEDSVQQLGNLAEDQWRIYANKWEQMDRIILFYEVRKLLYKAVCLWTGVPLYNSEIRQRTEDLSAMIDGAGSLGPRHWKGRLARNRMEKWIANLIIQIRNKRIKTAKETILRTIARHRDLDGELLKPHTAAVELINILRPTVAVSRFITFAALALHRYPDCIEKIRTGDTEYMRFFIYEVRRYYPFFPFVMARVKKDFTWKGYHFPKGLMVLLDLYGTNHDPKVWENPHTFRPERFRDWDGNAFNYIPQGGGNHYHNHRCPGELPTVKLMDVSLNFLVNHLKYEVSYQNLDINLSRIPAIPQSRFIMEDVQQVKVYG